MVLFLHGKARKIIRYCREILVRYEFSNSKYGKMSAFRAKIKPPLNVKFC